MKNLIKTTLLILGTIVGGFFYSCQKDDGVSDLSSDDALLIEAIQNATNKVAVGESDLPSASITVIGTDYSDSYTNQAMLAPELGYEVSLRTEKGGLVGEVATTYFDLNGRELNTEEKDGKGRKGTKGDKGRKKCFDFVLPVTFTMPDGSSITVEDESGWESIKSWYEVNPDSKERPIPQFPIDVVFEDGTTQTFASEEEMKGVLESCKANEGRHEKCFDFVLPVTFTMPDGTEIIVEDETEWDTVKEWHEANPDVKERPTIHFPVDLLFEDGTTLTVNNEDEMKEAMEGCKRGGKKLAEVVVEELVRNEECGEIVSGFIELYNEDDNLVGTIDFGEGECDGIVTKCRINNEGETECKDVNVNERKGN